MSTPHHTEQIAGLRTLVTEEGTTPHAVIILLHGYAMVPEDLAPFGRSLGVPAWYLFPEGPEAAPAGGRAWWHIDTAAREAARLIAPRDLASEIPAGLPAARALPATASDRRRLFPGRHARLRLAAAS